MNEKAQRLVIVVLSVFLGMTSLVVSFVATAAFETPGKTSIREISAGCVAIALYLAFCQFWVAPRGSRRFWAKIPTLVALIAPLLVVVTLMHEMPRILGILLLTSGCVGSVIGAVIAQGVTATPQRGTPTTGAINRGKSSRKNLLAGFILLVAVALLIPIGVIPSVVADTAPGFNAGPTGVFLGITVVFDLLAAALLASAIWGSRARGHSSNGTLGITAFIALLLALIYCAFGILVGGHGSALRIASVLLVLCAVFGFITTALMTVASVIVDRARLCA